MRFAPTSPRFRRALVLLLLSLLVVVASSSEAASALPFCQVTSNADQGSGSLRQAILDLNGGACDTEVDFVPMHAGTLTVSDTTISVQTALPVIVKPVYIDGYGWANAGSQPIIDGNSLAGDGLSFGAGSGGSHFSAMMIEHFTGDGVQVQGADGVFMDNVRSKFNTNGVHLISSSNDIFSGGPDSGGSGDGIGNNTNDGIFIELGSGNMIGRAGVGNDISLNGAFGIEMQASDGNSILNNAIHHNTLAAVRLLNSAQNVIGGQATGDPNTIFSNGGDGSISLDSIQAALPSSSNTIDSNQVSDFPNAAVSISGGATGGTGNNGNQILNNAFSSSQASAEGVVVHGPSHVNRIEGNTFGVAGKPIDLGSAPKGNDAQAAPVLQSVDSGTDTVTLTLDALANEDYRIEFYGSNACGAAQSLNGAQIVTTNGSGHYAGTLNVVDGSGSVTAIATDYGLAGGGGNTSTDGDTSEVSNCVTASSDTPDLTVSVPDDTRVAGGGASATSVTVTNHGTSASSGGQITFTLPTGGKMFYGSGGCGTSNTNILTCSLPTITAGATTSIDVSVGATADEAPAPYTLHADVSDPNEASGNTGDNGDDGTLTVSARADLAVSLTNTVDNPPVVAGGPTPGTGSFSTQATVTNAGGPSDSHGYQVTYALSTTTAGQSLTDVKFSALSGTCVYTPLSSDDTVVCTSSTSLTPSGGGSSEAATALRVDAASAALGSYAVTATVAPIAPVTDPGPSSNTDSQSTNVEAHADLSITATAGTPQIAGKSTGFDYKLTVHNGGPSVAHGGYTAHLPLEAGVAFSTTGSTAGCQAAGNGVDCSSNADLASGATAAYTVHVTTDPAIVPDGSQLTGIDLTDTATVALATVAGQSDQDPTNNHSDVTVHVDAQADLALSEASTHGTGVPPYVAGDSTKGALSYVFTVTNRGESTHKGSFTVTDTLPTGFIFQSTSTTGCSATGQQVTCIDSSAIAPLGTKVFTVDMKINSHVIDGTYQDGTSPMIGASVATGSTATQEPSGAGGNNTGTPQSAHVITKANLVVTAMTASSQTALPANGSASNTVTFTLSIQNTGPSDTQGVVITSPPPGASTLPAFTFSPASGGEIDGGGGTRQVTITAHANPALGHAPPPTIVSGPFLVQNSLRVEPSSPTTEIDDSDNVKPNALSPGITINTAPSPPQSPFAIPGTSNAIVTWEAPAANGGQAINEFRIEVTGPTGQTVHVPFTAPHTTPCGNVKFQDCYQATIGSLKPDAGAYTFKIYAVNVVGDSDPGIASATPSKNAQNTTLAINTGTSLTTCKTATLSSPVCVVYTIPSGAGGVFGAQGNLAANLLGANVCGGPCTGFGSQILASLFGYNDPTHPLQVTITFDSSEIPAVYKSAPVCPNNSTSKLCYPNNVKWSAEMSFALGLPQDPGGTLLTDHFCASPVINGGLSGGAGNPRYARPNPHITSGTNYLGYPDSSGSACLAKTNILGSKPDQSANGDVQVQMNLTSDSDQSFGKH